MLTEMRTQVVTDLETAGINAIEYVKETILPPVAVVVPADPYIEPGDVFGMHVVFLHVLLIGGKGTSNTAAKNIDSMIEDVISALDDWDLTEVTQPGEVTLKGNQYLGAVINIQQDIKFE